MRNAALKVAFETDDHQKVIRKVTNEDSSNVFVQIVEHKKEGSYEATEIQKSLHPPDRYFFP